MKHLAGLRFDPEGQRALKNIAEPVELFRIAGDLGGHSYVTAGLSDEALRSAAPEPARHAHSLLILPFRTLGGEASHDYLSDGFTDDLITELSRFRDVFTISRNTSFGLKGTTLGAAELGRKLGVRFCLEGSLRLLGDGCGSAASCSRWRVVTSFGPRRTTAHARGCSTFRTN